MVIQLESREHLPGVLVVNPDKDNNVFAFTGEAFLRNFDYLIDAGVAFAGRNIWTLNYARERVTKGFGVEDLTRGFPLNDQSIAMIMDDPLKVRKIPSVLLFRDGHSAPGEYLGLSAQRTFVPQIRIEERLQEEIVMHNILRVFDKEGRDQQRGRLSVQLALFLHKEAGWYFHTTANGVAAYINTVSESLNQEFSYPWRHRYDEHPKAYTIAKAVIDLLGGNSELLEPNGVIRNYYLEPNQAVEEPRPGSSGGFLKIHTTMRDDFSMGPLDAVCGLFKVGQNNSVMLTQPVG